MLESEAKSKWCPMYQSDDYGDNRWHEEGLFERRSCCLGSTCGAWRDDGYNDKAGEREGHCGLAR